MQLAKAFGMRHEPEPPNSRLKLPMLLVVLAVCVALAVTGAGAQAIVFIVLGAIVVVQIGYVQAGRNPWWMQDAKRERTRYTAVPPRDIEPN